MSTLVVVGGGPAPGAAQREIARRARRKDADAQLLGALPPATQVLCIGRDAALLGAAYRRTHSDASWREADRLEAVAPAMLDGIDLVVLADGVERLADPLPALRLLAAHTPADARLVACVRNAAQIELLGRLIEADLTPAHAGAWTDDALRRDSPASLFKLLMDAGWMPNLAAHTAAPARAPLLAAARGLADAMGVPPRTAERTLGIDWMIVEARKLFAAPQETRGAPRASFSVVVPTTRESQMRLNVEVSPGLQEVGARIVAVRGTKHPGEALERSREHGDAEWVLFCHQDVYFPSGFGRGLNALLDAIPVEERARTLIGFAGVGANLQANRCEPAGFVIDRTSRFDHPASQAAVSIDELAVVVARDSLHRIDPALGWHLWATDLCLTAITQHRMFARLVRLPLFHNSSNDFVLPEAFHRSAGVLAAKHAGFGAIHTLCGVIDASAGGGSAPDAIAPRASAAGS
jgi:hypothetical protein